MGEGTQEKKAAKHVLNGLLAKSYQDAYDAKARGEKIGWATSNFPQEICQTLGLQVVYPENQAAAIAARGAGESMCNHAEGMGYSNDICAYARVNLAYADLKECPNGEQDMPMPDFLLCCDNICNCVLNWYENLSEELGIPLIVIDTPFNEDFGPDSKRAYYVKGQFDDAIRQLEEITGKKWDEKKFEQVCECSQRTAKAWLEAASYANYEPSPVNGFDLFNYMAVCVVARGTKEAADALEQLCEELRQNVREGKSSFRSEEKHRILFEGIACWPHLRETSTLLKERGINVSATVYAAAFGILYENSLDMMRAYSRLTSDATIEQATQMRIDAAREGHVDGMLIHVNRSCKNWSGMMFEMGRRIESQLNIPVVYFDGDQADPRNYSSAQYATRIQGLAEIMEQNKKEA